MTIRIRRTLSIAIRCFLGDGRANRCTSAKGGGCGIARKTQRAKITLDRLTSLETTDPGQRAGIMALDGRICYLSGDESQAVNRPSGALSLMVASKASTPKLKADRPPTT